MNRRGIRTTAEIRYSGFIFKVGNTIVLCIVPQSADWYGFRETLIKIVRYKLRFRMIKIKTGNARHANNMGRTSAKPASIFPGNAEVDYSGLKLIVHVLI